MNTRSRDLTGERFGRWLVLGKSEAGTPKSPQSKWRCRCDCGRVKERVLYVTLVWNGSQSCGCLRRDMQVQKAQDRRKRGEVLHVRYRGEYAAWQHIKTKCYNGNHPAYARYGGRGVVMCAEWRESFEAFLRDVGEKPERGRLVLREGAVEYGPVTCGWVVAER